MFASSRCGWVLLGVVYFMFVAAPNRASAVTAEVAKACRALTAKEFPPREVGNPASGSTKGSGPVQTAYFNKCVANGGKMDSGKVDSGTTK